MANQTTFSFCFTDAAGNATTLQKKLLAEAEERYNNRVEEYISQNMFPAEAHRKAYEETIGALRKKAKRKHQSLVMQTEAVAQTQRFIRANMAAMRNIFPGESDADLMLKSLHSYLLGFDERTQGTTLTGGRDGLQSMANVVMELDKLAKVFGADRWGNAKGAELELVVRRLVSGEEVIDHKLPQAVFTELTEIANAIIAANRWIAVEMNKRGANIPVDGHHIPQEFNMQLVYQGGKDKFFAAMRENLDIEKMKNYDTNQPMTAKELDSFLDDYWNSLVNLGEDIAVNDEAFSKNSLVNQISRNRVWHYKNAEAQLKMQKLYGNGTPFMGLLMKDIKRFATFASAIDHLGPDPQATLKQVVRLIGKQKMIDNRKAIDAGKSVKSLEVTDYTMSKQGKQIMNMYDHYMGLTSIPVNSRVAAIFSNVRSYISTALLHGASILAIPGDTLTTSMRLKQQGGSPFRAYARAFYGSKHNEAIAGKAGFVAQRALGVIMKMPTDTNIRFAGAATGLGPRMQKWQRFYFQITGLEPVTDFQRTTYYAENVLNLEGNLANSWNKLNKGYRSMLERAGFDSREWDFFRKALARSKKADKDGEMSFAALAKNGGLENDLAIKYLGQVDMELEFAVPLGNDRVRWHSTLGGTQPGTTMGEISRSLLQFANYPISRTLHLWQRILRREAGGDKARWLAAMFAGSVAVGAVMVQTQSILYGRGTRDMTSMKFWTDALAKSGGGGLLIDAANQASGAFRRVNAVLNIGGPSAGFAVDMFRLPTGGADNALKTLKRWLPSHWAIEAIKEDFFDFLREIFGGQAAINSINRRNRARENLNSGN